MSDIQDKLVQENLQAELKALRHYKSTTVGLWATDKPDDFDDPKALLFKLSFEFTPPNL